MEKYQKAIDFLRETNAREGGDTYYGEIADMFVQLISSLDSAEFCNNTNAIHPDGTVINSNCGIVHEIVTNQWNEFYNPDFGVHASKTNIEIDQSIPADPSKAHR